MQKLTTSSLFICLMFSSLFLNSTTKKYFINNLKNISSIQKEADNGCAKSMYTLAMFFHYNRAYETSKELLLKAADKNYAKAHYELGLLYQYRLAVTEEESNRSDLIAIEHFRKSHESGYWPNRDYHDYDFLKKE